MIRAATSGDTSAILPIFLNVLHDHAGTVPKHFKRSSDSTSLSPWLTGILSDSRAFSLVAVENDTIIGYLFGLEIRKEESLIHPPMHYLSLEHVAVLPTHRRRGIATALIAALLSEAKVRKISRIALDVWSFNRPAQRFFARHGFNEVRRHLEADV